uniref:Histone acetyltransferase n=2 Tax=Panagrolaimus sp. PS1159 TaxID=55785 RepID=A0AC35F8R7_9BILA
MTSQVESNSKPNFLTVQQREEGIKKFITALVHAERCVDESCALITCIKLKKVMQHVRQCIIKRQVSQCSVCKQIVAICFYHAKTCAAEFCAVPFCDGIREKIAKKNEEAFIQEFGNLNIEDIEHFI